MRYKEYLFLQKIRCPKCERILGGKATYKKKNDKIYYYYDCETCENNIKEDKIEESILHLLSDILEYDSVVNNFFLPMLKSKLTNPKEELSKELKVQEMRKERVRKAYINEAFTLEEYKAEISIIENNIKELERQILENEQAKDLKFTKEDILIKRDIDFINKIKLPNLYNQIVITWKDLTREEKGKIIMNYIEDVTLKFDIDGIGYVRFSNYMPQEKLEQHIMRLREYYDVHYYEGILDFETGMFDTQKEDNDEVVRIFPIEKFDETKTKINMGMIGVSKDNETHVLNEEELFSTIPSDSIKSNEYVFRENN